MTISLTSRLGPEVRTAIERGFDQLGGVSRSGILQQQLTDLGATVGRLAPLDPVMQIQRLAKDAGAAAESLDLLGPYIDASSTRFASDMRNLATKIRDAATGATRAADGLPRSRPVGPEGTGAVDAAREAVKSLAKLADDARSMLDDVRKAEVTLHASSIDDRADAALRAASVDDRAPDWLKERRIKLVASAASET